MGFSYGPTPKELSEFFLFFFTFLGEIENFLTAVSKYGLNKSLQNL
jgi:hypothetical protein